MEYTRHAVLPVLLLAGLLLGACDGAPTGLRRTPPGNGPAVVFDLTAKPLPEVPFPTDLATRPDPSSPTGRRVNASLVAPTRMEGSIRQMLDQLDGFGTLQPVAVRFEAPLDIDNLILRHQQNIDYADDAVYLINIDRDSPEFGGLTMLDVGRGNYPITLANSNSYFDLDPRKMATNALFDTVEEDLNNNGRLDPGEDSDDDGVLDHPNVWPPGSEPFDGLMTFYESETDTLLLQPVVPLRERTTYAVVLTDRLVGRSGEPVRSPFPYVHHHSQAEALEQLEPALARAEGQGASLSIDDVSFAWVYSTQSVTADLLAIREGLNGYGTLSWLAERFPVDVTPDLGKDASLLDDRCMQEEPPCHLPSPYVTDTSLFLDLLGSIGGSIGGEVGDLVAPVMESMDENVAYVVQGSFESPDFLRTNDDALDPDNPHHEVFDIDASAGRANIGSRRITYIMSIPRETERHKPPFPVAVYSHSYSSTRIEAIGFGALLAREGVATVGIDAWGHGLPLEPVLIELIQMLAGNFEITEFVNALLHDRVRDLDGDGVYDSGGDYWTNYGFHTRDVVRQTVSDHLQLFRVLASFDGENTWSLDQDGDGRPDLAGDFDGDGRVDAGGPGVPYFATGQSMGAIHSGIIGALEPRVVATAPICGGGALSGVGVRTQLGNVRNAVMLRTMGPLVIGQQENDALAIDLLVGLVTGDRKLRIGTLPGAEFGDQVLVENLSKGEEHRATLHEKLRFRLSVEADRNDRFRVTVLRRGKPLARFATWPEDVHYLRVEEPTYLAGEALRIPVEGLGLPRCTPDLRRMLSLFQMIIEPADPANYARHYFEEPFDFHDEGQTPANLLEVVCLGDQDVPIQAQAAYGRAAGLIPHLTIDDRYGMTPNDWLISNYVYEGLAGRGRFPENDVVFDPDDLDENLDGFDAPAPADGHELRSKVETISGVSGVRFAYLQPGGMHGVLPTGSDQFDIFNYFVNLVARYFASEGAVIEDDLCLEDTSCGPIP